MKATLQKETVGFVPVIVTLETQEEVDIFYTMTNTTQITDALEIDKWYAEISDYASEAVNDMHDKLQEVFRGDIET